jgi:hypothetical protein
VVSKQQQVAPCAPQQPLQAPAGSWWLSTAPVACSWAWPQGWLSQCPALHCIGYVLRPVGGCWSHMWLLSQALQWRQQGVLAARRHVAHLRRAQCDGDSGNSVRLQQACCLQEVANGGSGSGHCNCGGLA